MLIKRACTYAHFSPYFNTSHVNVNQVNATTHMLIIRYFNTSHVNVNPATAGLCSSAIAISIHLMLMLILRDNLYNAYGYPYFNTSHVNVNQVVEQ